MRMMSRPVTSKPMAPGVTVGRGAGGGEIVAVEADVEDAGVDGVLLDGGDEGANALGDGDARDA